MGHESMPEEQVESRQESGKEANVELASKSIKGDGFNYNILAVVDPILRDNKDFMLRVLKSENRLGGMSGALEFASQRLKADKDLITAAMTNHSWETKYLKFADPEILSDRDLMLQIIKETGDSRVLEYVADDMLNDKDFILNSARTKHHGIVFGYASKELKNDYEFVKEIIKIEGEENIILRVSGGIKDKYNSERFEATKHYKYANEKQKADPNFVLEYLSTGRVEDFQMGEYDHTSLNHIPREVFRDHNFIEKVISTKFKSTVSGLKEIIIKNIIIANLDLENPSIPNFKDKDLFVRLLASVDPTSQKIWDGGSDPRTLYGLLREAGFALADSKEGFNEVQVYKEVESAMKERLEKEKEERKPADYNI